MADVMHTNSEWTTGMADVIHTISDITESLSRCGHRTPLLSDLVWQVLGGAVPNVQRPNVVELKSPLESSIVDTCNTRLHSDERYTEPGGSERRLQKPARRRASDDRQCYGFFPSLGPR
jgi:hypothetical protein